MIESAVTDLPQPDSPTIPSVFPFSTEADPVDGADDAVAGEEVRAEIVDVEQGHVYDSFVLGSRASRRPSAMKLAQTTSVAIATDGTMIAIGCAGRSSGPPAPSSPRRRPAG